ncbi:DNA ligase 1 [Euwallacea similis]|uniref:DNA ligase 1 n=1 Tax=Euwallacea similis TaxID=1736056 RepID=UPI00345086D7
MYSHLHPGSKNSKEKASKSERSKKEKKLTKLMASDSDTDLDSEHELSYYTNDRVKLMKQVLKIIKPKKIKCMAADCMKSMDLQEINSMLLEELLGISNKRLKYIFDGKTLEEESSTDDDQSVDIISLDDISDDDFVVISDEGDNRQKRKHKRKKVKDEPGERTKKVKKEKLDKETAKEVRHLKDKINRGEKPTAKEKEAIGEANLISVLELLELQARARLIKSQLELESKRKKEEKKKLEEEKRKSQENGEEVDADEIIIEVPKDVEIVITSSESDIESAK